MSGGINVDASQINTERGSAAEKLSTVRRAFDMDQDITGLTECCPLKTLEELKKWEGRSESYNGTHPYDGQLKLGRKTLVCHDMMGGYLEDRLIQGCKTSDCYQFYQWQYVDVFVYFSHCLVTIPPGGWINAAHRHSVPVLGTFITEWNDGKDICKAMLDSTTAYQQIADKLVDIACFYGFDGWLVNIENIIDSGSIDMLNEFVEYLTKKMHLKKAKSLVIWYDSVIKTGELKWQNELNHSNSMFFDSCDGIFLNYTWKEENLKNSAELAASQNRLHDIFVGIDVFGRGMVGGGGYNTCQAVDFAHKQDLSVAIFAPGWVYETQDKKCFLENDKKFWSMIHNQCSSVKAKHLPLVTSFCPGFGEKYYHNGEVISSNPWSNLSLQQIQPDFMTCQVEEKDPNKRSMALFAEKAYNGGHCLQLSGEFNTSKTIKFRLFTLNTCVPEQPLFMCLHICAQSSEQISMCVETESGTELILMGDDAFQRTSHKETGRKEFIKQSSAQDLPDGLQCPSPQAGWEVRIYSLGEQLLKGLETLKDLYVVCEQVNKETSHCEVLLGQLQILRLQDIPDNVRPVSNLQCHKINNRCLEKLDRTDSNDENCSMHNKSIVLRWGYPDHTADHFNIFQITDRGDFIYVGSAYSGLYVVDVEGSMTRVKYCVSVVHISGMSQTIQEAAKVTVVL